MSHAPGFLKLVNEAKKKIQQTRPEQVRERQAARERFFFVDVREDEEWKAGRAAGAIHIGKGVIERDVENLIPDKTASVVLYCGGGFRSALAADVLQQMGYSKVESMDGGIRRWRELGLPEERE